MLIVHAASLENQFVAGGYSYNNQYGNAIFTNDFVLAGAARPMRPRERRAPTRRNNIAQAFADVAAAGVNGNATFFTRGGTTTAPGTTVEEHAIWALVSSAGLTPTGRGAVHRQRRRRRRHVADHCRPACPPAGHCPDGGTVDGTGRRSARPGTTSRPATRRRT